MNILTFKRKFCKYLFCAYMLSCLEKLKFQSVKWKVNISIQKIYFYTLVHKYNNRQILIRAFLIRQVCTSCCKIHVLRYTISLKILIIDLLENHSCTTYYIRSFHYVFSCVEGVLSISSQCAYIQSLSGRIAKGKYYHNII